MSKKVFAFDTYCIKEGKSYKAGDEYKGKRTDLGHRFVKDESKPAKPKKETKKEPKVALEKKKAYVVSKTKK